MSIKKLREASSAANGRAEEAKDKLLKLKALAVEARYQLLDATAKHKRGDVVTVKNGRQYKITGYDGSSEDPWGFLGTQVKKDGSLSKNTDQYVFLSNIVSKETK